MKEIILKVTIQVPDDYTCNDPGWLLEKASRGIYEVTDVTELN